jgi:hypothetical protein
VPNISTLIPEAAEEREIAPVAVLWGDTYRSRASRKSRKAALNLSRKKY